MLKVTPFLWFDSQALEAATFYVSLFPNSKLGAVSDMTVAFELDGLPVVALNGGPVFKFNEAFSFSVDCQDQAEVDRLWDAFLSNGGEESQCGWLKDRYGLSWQIVPTALPRLLNDPDRAKAGRAMQAMMKMRKLVVADLEAAAAG